MGSIDSESGKSSRLSIERVKRLVKGLAKPAYARYLATRSTREWADMSARLRDTLARVGPEKRGCDDRPVFLLSAGWRSGSTLLQRMVMEHNKDILMWGEPFAHSNIWRGMGDQFRGFTGESPPDNFFFSDESSERLSDGFVANLYPDVGRLLEAHRGFYDAVFGEQSRARGHKTWGMKEVRLDIDDARYIRALYPQCKLLLLYRNPRDAYLSYRKLNAIWYRRWPDKLVTTAYDFGRNWAEIARGFIQGHEAVNGLLVRYEDLDDPAEVKRIEDYLGWPVPRSSQMRVVGNSRTGRLPGVQRILLDLGAGRTFRDAGYR